MERFSLSEQLLTVRLVETDLAALGVSLDGPGWKVGTDSQWDEGERWCQGGGAEAVLGRGCPSPRGEKNHAQPKGALHFHSHVPGGTGAFPLLQKDQCAYPSSL